MLIIIWFKDYIFLASLSIYYCCN